MHLVNRLRFEIRCSDEDDAFEVRQNLAALIEDVAREVIDAVCSTYVGADEVVRIDRVEVDLGRLNRHAIERDLAPALRSRFESALLDHVGPRGCAHRAPARGSRLDVLRHVLTTGALPWWEAAEEVDVDAIVIELASAQPDALRTFLRFDVDRSAVWQRIAYQLGTTARRAIVDLLPELAGAYADLAKAFADVAAAPQTRVASTLAEAAIGDPAPLLSEALLRAAPDVLAAPGDRSVIARIARGMTERADAPDALAQSAASLAAEERPPHAPQAQHRKAAVAATTTDVEVETHAGDAVASEHVVRHAGLILLAPFLERLFDACRLRERGRWTGKRGQYAAVHLLRYACTGQRQCAEHALLLEKVCCGVAIDEPLPRDVPLGADHIDEVDRLLAAVVEHWKALKNTSVAALRQTFLTRDGLLARRDGDWLLRVERKTLDVLVDRIPWGYSTLALPWNAYVIHVEW